MLVACPSCASQFRVGGEHVGKYAKCPKCTTRFQIPAVPTSPEVVNQRAERIDPPPVLNPKDDRRPRLPENQESVGENAISGRELRPKRNAGWPINAAVAAVALLCGYFLGREHLKYEVKSALNEASHAITDGFQKSLNTPFDTVNNAAATPAQVVPQSGSEIAGAGPQATGDRESLPKTIVEFGAPHRATGFELSVIEARIAKPDVISVVGEKSQGKDESLLVVLRVKNIDDRRILRFRDDNPFLGSRFVLKDDVENSIRGVSFGFSSHIVGALRSSDDILPGASVSHTEVFSVPPPKTKHLVLTVDLSAFGGDGTIDFKIPREKMAGFPGRPD